MFRPFRLSLETLEKREVFSAGALDSAEWPLCRGSLAVVSSGAALGDQPIAFNSQNVVDFETATRPHNDGLVPRRDQRQITATYGGDPNNSAVFEPNDEPLWLAAARDGAPNGLTSGYGIDFNPTVDQMASQSGVLGLDVWEHGVTDRDSVVTNDFNQDGRPDLEIRSRRDAASGLPTGVRSLLPDVEQDNEQDNVYRTAPAVAHDAFFAEIGDRLQGRGSEAGPSASLSGTGIFSTDFA